MKRARNFSWPIITLILMLGLLLVPLLWWPVNVRSAAQPQPAQNYTEAMARVAELQARDTDELFPECRSRLLTHGKQTHHSIVLFHGIVNCPAQFEALGQRFYALGYNVLIPRLPHHGIADPMSTAVAMLTAEELVASANEAVDIATGLGERVTVVGFSTGGTMAAWIAQERADVDVAVLLSAFLNPKPYPSWIVKPLARTLLLLPNQYWWWDETMQEKIPGPRYGYPRYPSHAIAEIMRLSLAVRQQAARHALQSRALLVVTNAGPRETVDNAATAQLVAVWQGQAGAKVITYELPNDLNLEHNYIDPAAPNQPVDVTVSVHPLLIEQIHRLASEPEPKGDTTSDTVSDTVSDQSAR